MNVMEIQKKVKKFGIYYFRILQKKKKAFEFI